MSSFVQNIVILLHIFHAGFCEVSTPASEDGSIPVAWPDKYHYLATKTHLTSGTVENIEYWRAFNISRKVQGAVTIVKPDKVGFRVKYEIHPETTNEYTNKLVCSITKGYNEAELDLLPINTEEFQYIGSDTLGFGEAEKFQLVDEDSLNKIVTTMWVKYENVSWLPMRLEVLVFGKFRENLQKHVVIDIINFDSNFSYQVFGTDQYDCFYKTKIEDNVFERHDNEINPDNTEHVENIFTEFLAKQKVQYGDHPEGRLRRKIFEGNMRRIIAHSSQQSTYKLGITKFIDRTPSEMERLLSLTPSSEEHLGTVPFPHSNHTLQGMAESFPTQYDLRLNGWITPVQDQLECKAAWAISVAGAIAAAHAAKTEGPVQRLSSQAIIDCAWGYKGRGCAGGSDTSAYQWAQAKGIPTELAYGHYANQNGYCQINKLNNGIKIKGYTAVPPGSITGIKYALIHHGPVTVSMAVPHDLILYTGGIFYSKDCDDDVRRGMLKLNHVVTVVGYGRYAQENFWIVKNTWGKEWGVDGYFFMSMRNNNCGVTSRPMYPVV